MNTQDITATMTSLREAFDNVAKRLQDALMTIAEKDEQLARVHDTNQRLEEDTKRLADRVNSLENELWQVRRAKDEAERETARLVSENERLTKDAEAKNEEIRKLRDVILNVATAVDNVVNPPKVVPPTELPPVERVYPQAVGEANRW